MARLTPWFSGHVKPARSGVYRVLYWQDPVYAKWSGGEWFRGNEFSIKAAAKEKFSADFEPKKWRGLAEEPK